ncbi:hypothetical protein L228DRAFT_247141 [Xylona heveae TC161]|uniref:Uncharacterized protein n=1 Tax=Xylona heveae (strain CBS 132557 / TC161) TaxID=1328760 RepID=A0A165GYF1_XYLHT|nr:hypothetical protein L228DRAFT_247141 [Xylona heveae TC161]KZF22760.1 hypothetical protein L228DRAFT_247141 [Xylona heveae TC161]
MAAGQETVSFDQIIRAGRQQKRDSALANEILGKSRRASAPGVASGRRSSSSLAARIGPAPVKRSATGVYKPEPPKPNIEGRWNHDLHHVNNPKASRVSKLHRSQSTPRIGREYNANKLFSALKPNSLSNAGNQAVVRNATASGVSPFAAGISIRGAAGPFAVRASNFAPGTTADDIQAALLGMGVESQGCRIMTARPTVMAELVFNDKGDAENVIAQLNGQKADGRILHVYMKDGRPSPASVATHHRPHLPHSTTPRERADINMEDERQEYQDGRYGYSGSQGGGGSGLYSDSLVTSRRNYR